MTNPRITQADREAAKSIEWVQTTIDDHEAIAQAFALHAAQARDTALDEVNRCARCRAYNSTTNTTGEGE